MELTDQHIIDFFQKDGKILGWMLCERQLKKYPEILLYMQSRFPFTKDIKEIYYLIYHHQKHPSVCAVCGKPVPFVKFNKGYRLYCSKECEHSKKGSEIKEEKKKQTNIEKYGAEYPWQTDEIKEKRKQTMLNRYGVEYSGQSRELLQKTFDTMLARYGVKSQFSLLSVKEKHAIKQFNNINGFTKGEQLCYEYLQSILEGDLIITQYKNKQYPFHCDFYIPKYNLYIEYNGTWTHGHMPYIADDKKCIEQLNSWKSHKDSNYYKNAIKVWTVDDVKKRATAKANNLNFLEIWSVKDFYKIDELLHTLPVANTDLSENLLEEYSKDKENTNCTTLNCSLLFAEKIANLYINQEYERIQHIEFPKLYNMGVSQCIGEYCRLVDNSCRLPYSYLVGYFHKSIIYAYNKGKKSPYKGWAELKENKSMFKAFLINRYMYADWIKKHVNEWLRGYMPEYVYRKGLSTSGKYPQVSYFKPMQAKRIINDYLSEFDAVFDPFSGYSGRMLGCLSSGRKYIGQDLNQMTIAESIQLYGFLIANFENIPACSLHVKDSIESSGEYDCLFTCSPYEDKENWNGDKDKKLTCDAWIDICISNYKCRRYVFVTDEKIIKYLPYVKETITNRSHWGTNNEYIVVIDK